MAANEARALGRGGITEVSRACGLSRKAIAKGITEIGAGSVPPPGRIRQPGAGRKRITEHDPRLAGALERLIAPDTRGDPESPLRWTCKSTRTLAAQLTRHKHSVSHMKVAQILHAEGYSLQGNRKTEEGDDHPDRDAQFRHINAQVKRTLAKGAPIIIARADARNPSGALPRAPRGALRPATPTRGSAPGPASTALRAARRSAVRGPRSVAQWGDDRAGAREAASLLG
jgi:hypothetical protein